MCYALGVSAKELATKLTRYSLNHDKDVLDADDLRGLQKEVRLFAPKNTHHWRRPPFLRASLSLYP